MKLQPIKSVDILLDSKLSDTKAYISTNMPKTPEVVISTRLVVLINVLNRVKWLIGPFIK